MIAQRLQSRPRGLDLLGEVVVAPGDCRWPTTGRVAEDPGNDVVPDPELAELGRDRPSNVMDAEVDTCGLLAPAVALLDGGEVARLGPAAREEIRRVASEDAKTAKDVLDLPGQTQPVLPAAFRDETPLMW